MNITATHCNALQRTATHCNTESSTSEFPRVGGGVMICQVSPQPYRIGLHFSPKTGFYCQLAKTKQYSQTNNEYSERQKNTRKDKRILAKTKGYSQRQKNTRKDKRILGKTKEYSQRNKYTFAVCGVSDVG